jgi:hypothetical protein
MENMYTIYFGAHRKPAPTNCFLTSFQGHGPFLADFSSVSSTSSMLNIFLMVQNDVSLSAISLDILG